MESTSSHVIDTPRKFIVSAYLEGGASQMFHARLCPTEALADEAARLFARLGFSPSAKEVPAGERLYLISQWRDNPSHDEVGTIEIVRKRMEGLVDDRVAALEAGEVEEISGEEYYVRLLHEGELELQGPVVFVDEFTDALARARRDSAQTVLPSDGVFRDQDGLVVLTGALVEATPKDHDFPNAFVGTVSGFRDSYALVDDQEGNTFCCDRDQLKLLEG